MESGKEVIKVETVNNSNCYFPPSVHQKIQLFKNEEISS